MSYPATIPPCLVCPDAARMLAAGAPRPLAPACNVAASAAASRSSRLEQGRRRSGGTPRILRAHADAASTFCGRDASHPENAERGLGDSSVERRGETERENATCVQRI